MKLLLDANLSFRLVKKLNDLFPEIEHITNLMLNTSSDTDVWKYARKNNFTIITKDSDFYELSLLHGIPPKIIWIKRKNCSTSIIEILLRENYDKIVKFYSDKDISCLLLL
jgi:predicted nuclease of predicted toxin-antitoxin system